MKKRLASSIPESATRRLIQLSFLVLFWSTSISTFGQWHSFKWTEFKQADLGGKRAGILLPVKLDGVLCDMQLDTGIGISVLYRNALPAGYSSLLEGETLHVEHFTLASQSSPKNFQLKYQRETASSRECGATDDSDLVGSIGNDMLINGSLSLDLVRGNYRLENGPFKHPTEESFKSVDIETLTAEGHGIFPIVTLSFGNGDKKKMVLDTGSASLGLVVHLKADWLKLVGLKGMEAVKPVYIARWGQWIPCYRAKIKRSVSMGDIKFDSKTMAMYCDDPRDSPQEGNQVFGFLGLAPFERNVIVLDYVSKKLFIK